MQTHRYIQSIKKLNYEAKVSSKTNWWEKSIIDIFYNKVQWNFYHVVFSIFEYVLLPSVLSIFFPHIFTIVSLSHYSRWFGWTLWPEVFLVISSSLRKELIVSSPLLSFLLPLLLAFCFPLSLSLFSHSLFLLSIYHSCYIKMKQDIDKIVSRHLK